MRLAAVLLAVLLSASDGHADRAPPPPPTPLAQGNTLLLSGVALVLLASVFTIVSVGLYVSVSECRPNPDWYDCDHKTSLLYDLGIPMAAAASIALSAGIPLWAAGAERKASARLVLSPQWMGVHPVGGTLGFEGHF